MTYIRTHLLSIDAWRFDNGWGWNNWHKLEDNIYWDDEKPMTARRVLRALRDWGYLTDASKGRLTIEDDGYNYVIVDRKTRKPLLALCYGEYEYA